MDNTQLDLQPIGHNNPTGVDTGEIIYCRENSILRTADAERFIYKVVVIIKIWPWVDCVKHTEILHQRNQHGFFN